MEKMPGVQTFIKYEDLEYVFKSDKLEVVDKNGIKYKKDFNKFQGDGMLTVSKYTKLSNLEKSVIENTFYFGSPIEWLDPFELLFFQPQTTIGEESITMHACCFACNDIENEEGFWQIWSKGEKEPIVRVTYNVNKLLTSLNAQNENQYVFYLAGMAYETRENILKQRSRDVSYESIDEYLNKLCLKRNAYKYENELRLFVKKMADDIQNTNTIINNINYNDGIITEITLPPAEPFGNSHPARNKMKEYQTCINSLNKQRLQKLVDEGVLTCKINQSALYCIDGKNRTYKI